MSEPTSSAARISSEPEPQAGSQIVLPGLGAGELGQQLGDGGGRVELAGLLARVGGEARNQVDVALADDVLGHARRAQVERRLVEVLQHVLEAAVAVLGPAEIGLGIEVDVAEHAFELGAVGVFDLLQRDVDQLADIGFVPLFIEVVEARAFGQDETLALQAPADADVVAAELLLVGFEVVVPEIGNVFQEQHHKDVVLVLPGIDDAPEGVAGRPCRLVDFLLCKFVVHLQIPLEI